MSVPDEIDDLIGVLRSPALASELVDENRTVAAMAGAFQSSERRTNMHSTSRRVRIGVLIATGIIGFGGVAAAGPGGVFEADDEVVEETTTTTELVDTSTTTVEVATTDAEALPPEATRTIEAPEEASAAAIEVLAVEGEPIPLVDDPSTTFDETMCLEGNHGKTVSAVARGELQGIDGVDIEVRDAAHSSCGKQDAESEAIEPEEDNESVETSDETTPAEEKKSGHGNGHGQSNGQGHAKSKGD